MKEEQRISEELDHQRMLDEQRLIDEQKQMEECLNIVKNITQCDLIISTEYHYPSPGYDFCIYGNYTYNNNTITRISAVEIKKLLKWAGYEVTSNWQGKLQGHRISIKWKKED